MDGDLKLLTGVIGLAVHTGQTGPPRRNGPLLRLVVGPLYRTDLPPLSVPTGQRGLLSSAGRRSPREDRSPRSTGSHRSERPAPSTGRRSPPGGRSPRSTGSHRSDRPSMSAGNRSPQGYRSPPASVRSARLSEGRSPDRERSPPSDAASPSSSHRPDETSEESGLTHQEEKDFRWVVARMRALNGLLPPPVKASRIGGTSIDAVVAPQPAPSTSFAMPRATLGSELVEYYNRHPVL